MITGRCFFTFKIIFLFVYFILGNIVATAAKRNIRVKLDANILKQLKSQKPDDFNLDTDGVFIKNVGKRTVLENQELLNEYFSTKPTNVNENREDRQHKRQIIAPGYYEAECSDKKPCKPGKYCNVLNCEDCHKAKTACIQKQQCCKGMVCTFGRCEEKTKGDPGTFCEKDTDCKPDSCCVLEPTVNTYIPICKPKLDEYHQCASVLYRKVWIGEKPDCGPCKQGLECTQKGILASHQVCMKPSK